MDGLTTAMQGLREELRNAQDVAIALAKERDGLASDILRLAQGRVSLVTCEEHDAQQWMTLDGLCPHCVVEGRPGTALVDVRVDIVELLRGHDRLVEARDALQVKAAALIGSDYRAGVVEAALDWLQRLQEEVNLRTDERNRLADMYATANQRITGMQRERDDALARAERAEAALVAKHGGEPVALLHELDAARDEVDRLRTVLAEPSEEEVDRLGRVALEAGPLLRSTTNARAVVRAILAHLRARAEVDRG